MKEVKSFLLRLLFMVILLWILFGMVFGIASMGNADMVPRISAGDLMLFYRLEKNLHSSDVVIFKKDGEQYAGRIVAKEGDTVEITDGGELKINGSIVVESDIYFETPRYDTEVTYPLLLAEGEYFILGDYREKAKDSRYFGPVDQTEIKGKVITVIRRSGL